MAKSYYLIKKNRWQDIVSELTKNYSLPEINHNLVTYFKNRKLIFEVNFHNNKCYLRSYNKSQEIQDRFLNQLKSTPPIGIENKNIKFFLKIYHQLKLNKATINQIVRIDYFREYGLVASVQLGTIVGDMLVVDRNYEEEIRSMLDISKYFSERLNGEELDRLIAKKHPKTIEVFNSLDTPNPVIQNYAALFSIDLSSGINTISHKIAAKSNDYSIYETYYKLITNSRLDDDRTNQAYLPFFKPLSIVIPSFNSESSIIKTLYSIESQDLSKDQKRLLDVIIVDDGSSNRVFSIIQPHLRSLSFKPRIVRLENNQGLPSARNLGFQLTRYDYILFIDSDILLSKNYLYEYSIRLQLIPNAIFISFKENVLPNDKLVRDETITKGLPISTNLNDKRLCRLIENDERLPNKTVNEGVQEILSETNLFKNFGYGRTINGCYDLPSMVVGHNMSMRKDIVNTVGGFSNHFSGWGLEDAYFGARAIAQGYFIIPVLTTSVYHINHPSRSGSMEKQLLEHKRNTRIYNTLIHEQL